MYDLHTHSHCSDGILSPQALVSRAKSKGVTHLALTDHDTVQGVSDAVSQAAAEDLTLIPGVEFSCLWNGMNIHIVGLMFDMDSPVINSATRQQLVAREQRAETIGQRLEKAGFKGAYQGAKAIAGDAVIGRPHFASHLIATGAVKDFAQAFKKYLGAGKIGDVKQVWPEVSTVVEWITAAGGVAVLAHPDKYKMTRTKLKRLLDDFTESGGKGFEVVSGRQEPLVTRDMAAIADQYQLLASCGSDFHVPDRPWQELGEFSPLPEMCVPVWDQWNK